MRVGQGLVEDSAADILLVQALHNHDDSRVLGAVQAGGHRLEEPVQCALPLLF